MYALLRPLLFALPAECAHDFALHSLRLLSKNRPALATINKLYGDKVSTKAVDLMGLKLKHPIGLAAGLDKQGVAGNALNALGFAWIEYGTVTPKPQLGNAKPRLFRLTEHQALINRMGFNSVGLEAFLSNMQSIQPGLLKGINIGKNAATPIALAAADYSIGMQAVYTIADYICLNISSPNTENLRRLQSAESLDSLLTALSKTRQTLADQHGYKRPLAVKIAPDLTPIELDSLAKTLIKHQIDGVIATNTTASRGRLSAHKHAQQAGGLSGAPLAEKSTACIRALRQRLQGEVAIIGSGGIMNAGSAKAKLAAGADALQLYTGFVYQGPALIRNIVNAL